jgi:hypothetical protein
MEKRMPITSRRGPGDALVTVSWGTYALAAYDVPRGGSFALGEGGFLPVPAACLGAERLELVRVSATGRVHLVLPPELVGEARVGDRRESLASFVDAWALASGRTVRPREIELPLGAEIDLALAGSFFRVRVEVGGLECAASRGLAHVTSPLALAMAALSLAIHGALVGVFVLAQRDLDADDAEGISRDQILLMRAMLEASAERELERPEPARDEEPTIPEPSGGASARAKGAEGQAGARLSASASGRMANAGPAENPDPHVVREQVLRAAGEFGLIGLLSGGAIEALPDHAFDDDPRLGRDAVTARGSLFDPSIGDRFGQDGLGALGPGLGGGGDAETIGIARVGGLTPGLGLGPKGDGHGTFAGGRDGPAGGRPRRGPSLRAANVESNGRLDPEVIKRAVRQQFGRFRFCYEVGLAKNPALTGRVSVRFVIDRGGAVTMAQDAGSDLADEGVVTCVTRAFLALSFPAIAGGVATVTYPIVFSPGVD